MTMHTAIQGLLATPTSPALRFDPRPGCRAVSALRSEVKTLVGDESLIRLDLASSLVLCWHDHYDASHDLCQAHEGQADADYIHAILHRREGDAGNAGYWFRRVGKHPVFPAIAAAALKLGRPEVVVSGRLDPMAVIQLTLDEPQAPDLIELQAQELRLLLQHVLV